MKSIVKKITAILLVAMTIATLGIFAACSNTETELDIFVVARESGSGTRGAFEELLGLPTDGSLFFDAEVKSTDLVTKAVSRDKYAIGYISLGSLNDTVKAVKVGGVEATTENVINGTYKISRPFLVVTKKGATLTAVAKDFQKFLQSKQAQDIIKGSYVSIYASAPSYTKDSSIDYANLPASDKITINGSTSVGPLMDKLIGEYVKLTGIPATMFDHQKTGSGDGIKAATNGTAIFGTSSRDLKDTEKPNLDELKLCLDGVAVIVNKQNTSVTDLTLEQIKKIYLREIKMWSEIDG